MNCTSSREVINYVRACILILVVELDECVISEERNLSVTVENIYRLVYSLNSIVTKIDIVLLKDFLS